MLFDRLRAAVSVKPMRRHAASIVARISTKGVPQLVRTSVDGRRGCRRLTKDDAPRIVVVRRAMLTHRVSARGGPRSLRRRASRVRARVLPKWIPVHKGAAVVSRVWQRGGCCANDNAPRVGREGHAVFAHGVHAWSGPRSVQRRAPGVQARILPKGIPVQKGALQRGRTGSPTRAHEPIAPIIMDSQG